MSTTLMAPVVLASRKRAKAKLKGRLRRRLNFSQAAASLYSALRRLALYIAP